MNLDKGLAGEIFCGTAAQQAPIAKLKLMLLGKPRRRNNLLVFYNTLLFFYALNRAFFMYPPSPPQRPVPDVIACPVILWQFLYQDVPKSGPNALLVELQSDSTLLLRLLPDA